VQSVPPSRPRRSTDYWDEALRVARIIGSLIGVIVVLGCAWLTYVQMFPAHACRFLYADELTEVRAVVDAVEKFRSEQGRLPAPSPDLGYVVLEDESYEVRYTGFFDGPNIGYVERGKTWVCDP
jgi:hypothetical protein